MTSLHDVCCHMSCCLPTLCAWACTAGIHSATSAWDHPGFVLCYVLLCRFEPGSVKFTLESVVSLRLDQHCEFIAELSVTASKEQAIETSLANITSTWAELQLDMVEYKGTYKLRSTEDIFVALEDNGVTLSTMKASKFYLVFDEEVARWERTLALASETVEMILQVLLPLECAAA